MARPAKTTIVDAIKTENSSSVNVPVRLDASALAKALQATQIPTEARVNAGELIKNSALKIEEMYARFEALKALTNELNGKSFNDPVPPTLKISEIVFKFQTVKDGVDSAAAEAVVKNVICVGDIANLLSGELGSIIGQLEQEAAAVKNIATLTEETSSKAKASWEANNPTRKFSTGSEPEATEQQSANAPSSV